MGEEICDCRARKDGAKGCLVTGWIVDPNIGVDDVTHVEHKEGSWGFGGVCTSNMAQDMGESTIPGGLALTRRESDENGRCRGGVGADGGEDGEGAVSFESDMVESARDEGREVETVQRSIDVIWSYC